MGGVHFVPQKDGQVLPLLWRSPFHRAIQERLVSFDNRAVDINNSELELAASVAQHDILAKKIDIRESTIHNSSNQQLILQCSHGVVAAEGLHFVKRPHHPPDNRHNQISFDRTQTQSQPEPSSIGRRK
jgi:hypothetical protein